MFKHAASIMISILILHFNSSHSNQFSCRWNILWCTRPPDHRTARRTLTKIYFLLYPNKVALLHPMKLINLTVFDTFDCLARIILFENVFDLFDLCEIALYNWIQVSFGYCINFDAIWIWKMNSTCAFDFW